MFELWFTEYTVEFISCSVGLILLLSYCFFKLKNIHEKKKKEKFNKKLKELRNNK